MNFRNTVAIAAACLSALLASRAIGQTPVSLGAVKVSSIPVPAQSSAAGDMRTTWDGDYADLLAADAFAVCWWTLSGKNTRGGFDAVDTYLSGLRSKMSASSCAAPTSGLNADHTIIKRWVDSRLQASCNADTDTGAARGIDLVGNVSRTTSLYQLPSATTLGLTGASATAAVVNAQLVVDNAEIALCMAQQMRQHLNSPQLAFASSAQVERLTSLIVDRAQLAVNQYAALAKVFSATNPGGLSITDSGFYLPALSAWRTYLQTSNLLDDFGRDFASAIEVLIDSTTALAEHIMRKPAVQSSFGQVDNQNAALQGELGGPRRDLLALLYGRNAISSTYGSVPNMMPTRDLSQGAARALALARQLTNIPLSMTANNSADIAATANNLLAQIETSLLSRECASKPSGSFCPTFDPNVPYGSRITWTRHGVSRDDAKDLVRNLFELIAGVPNTKNGDVWTWDPDIINRSAGTGATSVHLVGQHSMSGTTILLDPKFSVVAYEPFELQARQYQLLLYPYKVDLRADPMFHIPSAVPAPTRGYGVVPTLAVAREALLLAATGAPILYQNASSGRRLIEDAVGNRTIALRPQYQTVASPRCAWCVTYSLTPSGPNYMWALDMIIPTADPATSVVTGYGPQPLFTAAKFSNHRTLMGLTQTNVASFPSTSFTWNDVADGLARRSATVARGSGSDDMALRTPLAPSGFRYEPISVGTAWAAPATPLLASSKVVTFGGTLNALVAQAFTMSSKNWSLPAYDAFGLPTDWAPAADASLSGGEESEALHTYFLRVARQAATEAADAASAAMAQLSEQAIDNAALATAEQQGSKLADLERQAVCGKAETCSSVQKPLIPNMEQCLEFELVDPYWCNSTRQTMVSMFRSPLLLAQPVAQAVQDGQANPTFSEFSGGELQQLYVRQWSAWQALRGAIHQAMDVAAASDSAGYSLESEITAADLEYTETANDLSALYDRLIAQSAAFQADKTAYLAAKTQYDAEFIAALQDVGAACSRTAMQMAINASSSFQVTDDLWSCAANQSVSGTWTYVGAECQQVVYNGTGIHRPPHYPFGAESFSWGPIYEAQQRCEEANRRRDAVQRSYAQQRQAMQDKADAAEANAQLLLNERNDIPAKFAAALARKEAIHSKRLAGFQQSAANINAQLNAVRDAVGAVLDSYAAVFAAHKRLATSVARLALQQTEQQTDIKARYGVRRRYRSYEVWRARALIESARRLAVAARRTIESRYAVQLSRMNTTEPFVEAPAIWSDDVYASDLQPFTIGREQPTDGQAAAAHQVLDYVRNLELFINGFTIDRPTSEANTDAEVISLAGPAYTETDALARLHVQPGAAGWTFWCPNLNTSISHPAFSDVSESEAVFDLATACSGSPPTEARIRFQLSPNGNINEAVMFATGPRYNVRWRQLALNLVGSGIRDCSRAAQSTECYEEPFLRYRLKHVGPAVVTTFDQSIREQDIPAAVIDDGKALAIEEWLDPISQGWSIPEVQAAARHELLGRPMGGTYELALELTPDVRVERIERIQLLTSADYWVRQE